MTNLLTETQKTLQKYDVKLRKRMGQNFIIDSDVLDKQIAYANLQRTDIVLEIGAGIGTLTRRLAEHAKEIIAVEKDSRLLEILKEQCAKYDNITIIHADILQIDIPFFTKAVSNIPYSISSPLTFKLLMYNFDYAILTYQIDFAKRLMATVGAREYSRLSVTTYYRAKVSILEKLSRTVFYPSPKVDSALVKITPHPPPFHVADENLFYDVVRALFGRKNRKVKTMLAIYLDKQKTSVSRKKILQELTKELPFLEKRVRQISPEEIGLLTNHLLGNNISPA
ncbi:MAG: 16S rRNA (adenine(1518)-N(6)/adenine(1519)-N(6))-dimethyltransferase RsmA [Promethearchaeota archaeon]